MIGCMRRAPGVFARMRGMQFLFTVLGWIVAAIGVFVFFSLTILVHEGGHFFAAKLLGLRADVFSIGFGPAVWKRKRGGTEYRMSAVPFGGYVALPQLDPAGMEKIQGGDGAETLPPAVWWKRLIVAVAGPFGNIVFAALLALAVWALPPAVPERLEFEGAVIGAVEEGSDAEKAGLRAGDTVLTVAGKKTADWNSVRTEVHLCAEGDAIRLSVSNIFDGAVAELSASISTNKAGYLNVGGMAPAGVCAVAEVAPDSPAWRAGLRRGDVMRAVNGRRIVSSDSFVGAVRGSGCEPVAIEFVRDGESVSALVTPEMRVPDGETEARPLIGVVVAPVEVTPPQWALYRLPQDQLRGDAASIFRILRPLFVPGDRHKGEAGRIGRALGGPILILSNLWITMFGSFGGMLAFVRFLNVNLAIVNLLPVPVLDGGHVVFALWRGAAGRELPTRVMNALVNAFAVLIIALFVLLSFRDVASLVRIFGN